MRFSLSIFLLLGLFLILQLVTVKAGKSQLLVVL